MKRFLTCCLALFSFFLLCCPIGLKADDALVLPAFAAYSEPDPEALEIGERGGSISDWSDGKTSVVWYGMLRTPGELSVSLQLRLPADQSSKLRLRVGDRQLAKRTVKGSGTDAVVDFGKVSIKSAGAYRFELSGLSKTGATFGEIQSLVLAGPATKDAVFNLTAQRGAPSVHLGYPIPESKQAQWFYNEVTAKADPIATYYEACGFSRGYFGIQVNSPTERRIIFSVWDAGKEAVDRNKVAAENRVELLAKGEGVVAESFGNEGTGGHSHLVYPWKTGDTYRFLVIAEPQGDKTVYTAYFYFPEKQAWGLIASFRAPKDGGYLRGLYSFNEDFWGANGQRRRLAEFGNQWIKTIDGEWIELTKARFTHTARGKYKDRLDHYAGVSGDRFFLSSGGFLPETMEHGTFVNRPAAGQKPNIVLPAPGM